MESFDTLKDLKKHSGPFTEKFTQSRDEALGLAEGFEKIKAEVKGVDKATLTKFEAAVSDAQTKYNALGKTENGVFTVTKGSEEAAKKAKETLDKAKGSLKDLLSGKEVELDSKKFTLNKTVTETFTKAEEAAGKVVGTAKGWTGRIRAQGFGEAIKQGTHEATHAFGKSMDGRRMVAFGRIGAVGIGGAMVVQSIAKSEGKDGEPRGALTRAVQAAAGVGVAGAGLAMGAVR